MSYDEDFLRYEELTSHEIRGLRILRAAVFDFEPLAKRPGLGPTIAERLVELKLAEKGDSDRYPSSRWGDGYRLSDLGWKVLERGARPKGSSTRTRLKEVEPRLQTLEPRLKTRF